MSDLLQLPSSHNFIIVSIIGTEGTAQLKIFVDAICLQT